MVARIPADRKTPLEIVFRGNGTQVNPRHCHISGALTCLSCQEAFHVLVQPDLEFVQRWAVTENTTTGLAGEPGEGTTVDLDEPFILRSGGQKNSTV